MWIERGATLPSFLHSIDPVEDLDYALYPFATSAGFFGTIAVGYRDPAEGKGERTDHGRHLAGQVAIALSNSHLARDLDELSWGALQALGKAVDSMSPWTAGHSERVAALAMEIGHEMGLRSDEIDILHRGGLLHDVGKIGVPSAVLEKPGRLTEDEFASMLKYLSIPSNGVSLSITREDATRAARSGLRGS